MPKQWQGAIFVVIVLAIFLILAPETQSPGAIINKTIHQSSVAVSPEINVPQETNNLDIKTHSALAKEIGNGKIFYEFNPEQRWPLASLTKLMTAVVAMENIPLSAERNNLIKRMMIASDNEAADELARKLGQEKFIAAMNDKAQDLKMEQTSFFDSSGLSFLNQSTVRDLDRLIISITENQPQIFQWSREPSAVIDGQTYFSINHFAGQSDFLGGKTGWTEDASGNLVSLFSGSSHPLVIIVLGTPTKNERFAQTLYLKQWISQYFKR